MGLIQSPFNCPSRPENILDYSAESIGLMLDGFNTLLKCRFRALQYLQENGHDEYIVASKHLNPTFTKIREMLNSAVNKIQESTGGLSSETKIAMDHVNFWFTNIQQALYMLPVEPEIDTTDEAQVVLYHIRNLSELQRVCHVLREHFDAIRSPNQSYCAEQYGALFDEWKTDLSKRHNLLTGFIPEDDIAIEDPLDTDMLNGDDYISIWHVNEQAVPNYLYDLVVDIGTATGSYSSFMPLDGFKRLLDMPTTHFEHIDEHHLYQFWRGLSFYHVTRYWDVDNALVACPDGTRHKFITEHGRIGPAMGEAVGESPEAFGGHNVGESNACSVKHFLAGRLIARSQHYLLRNEVSLSKKMAHAGMGRITARTFIDQLLQYKRDR